MASILSNSPNAACLLVLLLETTIGTVSNAIVMAIILKGKKIMKTGNIIRISLNTSNVCCSILVFASVFSGILSPGNVPITDPTLAYTVYSLIMFTMSSSSWLTAILSFYYFIKILDFKARAIVWTKKNINAVLPCIIIGVEVVAALSSFLSVMLYLNPQKSSMNDSMITLNSSVLNTDMGLSTALIVSCAPFLIIVVTNVCTTATLKRHSHNMMKNMGTINNKPTKRLNNTVFKIKCLLLAYCFYYLCALLLYYAVAAHLSVQFWVSLLMLSSYTMVQSVLLVIGNPKLQEAAKEMLKCTICCEKIHS